MKYIYLIIFLLTATLTNAQIPAGYYNSATGTGYTLKTQLKNIITTGHINQGYNALDNEYINSDADDYYENDGSVLDMYSENPSGADPYNYNFSSGDECGNYDSEADCYNKEHIFPQGFFNEQLPMRSDLHHVVPTDGRVNGFRSNYPFGVVGTNLISQSGISNPTQNGSKLGNCIYPGYTETVFEPIDEFKGDIARMLLYFAVRYEDNWNDSGWEAHTVASNPLNGTSDQFYETWYINLLLDWHNNDAVNQREIDRNNEAYNYQGNRNPFIDNPDYADMIWNTTPDIEAPTDPTNLVASNPTDTSIDLSWTVSTDNISVSEYDIYVGGINTFSTTSAYYTVNGLTPATNYCFTIKAKDAAGNESGFSNQACETTTNNGSGSTNCASESFTNIPLGQTSYENRSWTGDNGLIWNATEARTDNTINGPAIVLDVRSTTNGALTSPEVSGGIGDLTLTTQRKYTGGTGDLSVYVNSVLKGTIPYDDTVQTTTISNINVEGTITVIITEDTSGGDRVAIEDLSWTCYSTLSTNETVINQFKVYPNPIKGSALTIKTSKKTNYTIYDVLGKHILSGNIDKHNTSINVTNLKKGIYILKLETETGSVTKKLIKQ